MATSSKPKSLDPRLARMATRGDDSAAARWMSGLAAATPAMPNGARVLVMLASEDSAGVLSPYQPARLHERLYTATVPLGRLDWLANHPDVLFVEAGRQLGEHLETSAPEIGVDKVWPPSPPGLGFDGKGVVVGIIDYGLDVCLADFADAQGTRVAFMWDQSLVPVGASEASPANFPYGVEYDKTAINAARAVGRLPNQHVRHEPRPGSHGTHVAGIAASNGSSTASHKGMAPAATIVFVQPAPTDTEGSLTDSVRVADAIAYVFQKARELRMPCVINMSLGQNGGSHDGESLVERAIDAMVAEQGRAFVCAAGNEHVWAGHAEGMLQLGMDVSLEWVMGAASRLVRRSSRKAPIARQTKWRFGTRRSTS
jgi:subtilisin family serine protease